MPDPEVTAAIPTYRRPKLLRRAIRSVLEQTYTNVRVHVFDNASGDETGEVVADLARRDGRVRYHCHPTNLGARANFQHALESMETPYFSFLSDDDLLLPGFYRHGINTLARHDGAKFFCGQTVIWDVDKGSAAVRPDQGWSDGIHEAGRHVLRMGTASFTWTGCIFASEIRGGLDPLDPTFGDAYLLLQAAAHYPFVVSLVPCALFSAHKGGGFSAIPPRQRADGYKALVDRLAAAGSASEADLAVLRRQYDERARGALARRVGSAFYDGDWSTFDEAVEVMGRFGGVKGRRRFLQFLGHPSRRGSLIFRGARRVVRLQRRWLKWTRRRRRPPAQDLEAVIRKYGGLAIEKEEGASPPGSANAGRDGLEGRSEVT